MLAEMSLTRDVFCHWLLLRRKLCMRGSVEHSSRLPRARKQRSWEVRPESDPTAHCCNIYNETTLNGSTVVVSCLLNCHSRRRMRLKEKAARTTVLMSKSTLDVDWIEEWGQEESRESVVNQCHGWLELTQQTIASTQPLPHTPFWSLLLFHTLSVSSLSCPVISNTRAANGKQIMTWLLLNDIPMLKEDIVTCSCLL